MTTIDKLDAVKDNLTKQTTPSVDDRIYGLTSKIENLERLTRRHWMNFIKVYKIENTTDRTKLQFQQDLGNNPILKLEVLTIGGGLTLYPNNIAEGIVCSIGTSLEGVEIYNLEYQVTSGTAIIIIYSRID